MGCIHAVRRVKRQRLFLGAWDDFSFSDDQWVDEEDVKPRSKITKLYGCDRQAEPFGAAAPAS